MGVCEYKKGGGGLRRLTSTQKEKKRNLIGSTCVALCRSFEWVDGGVGGVGGVGCRLLL